MSDFLKLRPAVQAYVAAVVLVGAGTLGLSVHRLYADPIGTQWLVLAALTILTGSFSVKVPSINAYISVSETFVFASVLLFGTPAGTVTVLLECLVILLWMKPQGRPVHRMFFNMAAPSVAIWVSGTAFYLLSGIVPYSKAATPLPKLFLPLLAFTALYFLLNSWLVAIAVGLETQKSPSTLWWKNFAWLSVNYFSGASVAALIVTYTRELDLSTLAVIVPLLVVSYLTFRTAMGRAEDSYNHLAELNRLYLSTIETLAMAIDAKDQITHGHIRRVQAYAVALAKRIGVSDDNLLKAIEAAALLHDMGKLAVPEYILNKPGKLTPAEFEKMKLHASVGADILSAIDFPYPVVPIVRHHHENWNGSGYPAGLKATDIPIGARILSVVDCFDALTSDRPYRPRLRDEEALKILMERRGSMYDPLVVDTFLRVHEEIAPSQSIDTPTQIALNEITSSTASREIVPSTNSLDEIAASSAEMLTLYDLSRGLAGQASISDTGDVIAKHLRRLVPFSLSIIYLYDDADDSLVAKHSFGDTGSFVRDLRIPLGSRLSGWVAANRQTILNSDPVLDLGEIARANRPRLQTCLSAPLVSGDALVGVLSLYSTSERFTDDHRRIVEAVARHIAETFRRAAEFDANVRRDVLTGLPTINQLYQLLEGTDAELLRNAPIGLMFIDVANLGEVNVIHGRSIGDDVLRHLTRKIQKHLGVTDILFRCGGDEFVALITNFDLEASVCLAARIREHVRSEPIVVRPEAELRVDLKVHVVEIPTDPASFRELVAAGRSAVSNRREGRQTRVH